MRERVGELLCVMCWGNGELDMDLYLYTKNVEGGHTVQSLPVCLFVPTTYDYDNASP